MQIVEGKAQQHIYGSRLALNVAGEHCITLCTASLLLAVWSAPALATVNPSWCAMFFPSPHKYFNPGKTHYVDTDPQRDPAFRQMCCFNIKAYKKCLGDIQNKRINLKMSTIWDFSGQPPVPNKSQHFGSYNKLNIRTRRSAIKWGMKRSLGM